MTIKEGHIDTYNIRTGITPKAQCQTDTKQYL